MKILLLCDVTHATPRIPNLCDEFRFLGHQVELIDISGSRSVECSTIFNENHSYILFKELLSKNVPQLFTCFKLIKGYYRVVVLYLKFFLLKVEEKFTDKVEKFLPDVLISSYSPGMAHIVASHLSSKYDIKWIADYRDLWSLNHRSLRKKSALQIITYYLERQVLAQCSAIVTVTQQWADKQNKKFKLPCYSVPNGFSKEKYSISVSLNRGIIRFTGNIYEDLQLNTLTTFLKGLKKIKPDARPLFEIYGSKQSWIEKIICDLNLCDWVNQKGALPQHDIVLRQKSSAANILLGCNKGAFDDGYYLKMFEYIGACRPIVYVTDSGAAGISGKILSKSSLSYQADNSSQVAKILDELASQKYYPSMICDEYWESFTYSSRAKDYLNIIEKVLCVS